MTTDMTPKDPFHRRVLENKAGLFAIVTTVAITIVLLNWVPLLILMGISVPLLLSGLIVDRWLDKVDARGSIA